MKKKLFYAFILLTSLIIISIKLFGNEKTQTNEKSSRFSLNVIAGINLLGGIVENKEVDAVTGATKIGAKAGLRSEIHLANNFHFLETGLEYSYIPQEIEYDDASKNFNGKRSFDLNQIRLPLTYNMHFFNNGGGNPFLVTKLGLSISYLLFDNVKETGTLPSYSMNKWEMGMLFGLIVFPFHSDIGIFCDAYRGARKLYEDEYHTEEGYGDLTGFTLGVQYKFLEFQ